MLGDVFAVDAAQALPGARPLAMLALGAFHPATM